MTTQTTAPINRSTADLQEAADEAVQNGMTLNPKLPAANLAEELLRTADGDLRTDLSRLLLIKDFIARIRRLRAQQKRQERDSQLLFPELRGYVAQLPARLPIGDDVLVPSENACYADWQRYLKVLNAKDRDRHNNNKKIVAVKVIIKLWPESRKTRDTTLADIDELKARKAGII